MKRKIARVDPVMRFIPLAPDVSRILILENKLRVFLLIGSLSLLRDGCVPHISSKSNRITDSIDPSNIRKSQKIQSHVKRKDIRLVPDRAFSARRTTVDQIKPTLSTRRVFRA